MLRLHRRLRAFAFLFVLAPLWCLQSTYAHPLSVTLGGQGKAAKVARPGDDGPAQNGSSGGGCDCVRTQGYWKNHSAHADNPSQNIPWPISEETPICSSTWFEVINTPPQGEAWFILAHQWIAAELNAASGADTSVLGGTLDEASDLLANNCGGLSGDDEDRALELAELFDDYNNGRSGPPHCDEGCGGITDCNGNGIEDSIDIQDGTSQDVNNDGIPDECEFIIKDYCDGTGSQNGGVDCPCGNNAPNGITGCINSSGSGASLTAAGAATVSNDTLVLTATGIPSGRVAYFLFSHSTNDGVTFGDGIRCIQGFRRVQKVSHSSGSDVFPAPNSPPISQQLGITAGEHTFFQVVYRDGNGPCHSGANATNALAIVWGP